MFESFGGSKNVDIVQDDPGTEDFKETPQKEFEDLSPEEEVWRELDKKLNG